MAFGEEIFSRIHCVLHSFSYQVKNNDIGIGVINGLRNTPWHSFLTGGPRKESLGAREYHNSIVLYLFKTLLHVFKGSSVVHFDS